MAAHSRFLGIKISDELLARLRQRAAAQDRTVSAMARRILREALADDAPHA